MSWKAIDALDDARDATTSLLLPVDVGRWARLALIALFVGGLGGGGGAGNSGVSSTNGQVPGDFPVDSLPGFVTPQRVLLALVALAAVAVLVGLVWSFLGAVMEFVFVDGVVSKDVRIRGPFHERLGLGVRLFAFRLGLILAVLLLLGLPVAAVVLGGFSLSFRAVALLAVPLVMVAILVFFVLAVALQLTTDFVVPTMLAEDRTVVSSWRRVAPLFRAELSEFGLYVVLRFVLGILASIAVGIVTLLAVLVVAIPFAIVGGGVFVALSETGTAFSTVGLVLLGAVGLLFALAAIATGAVVQMPVVTFFRYYSLFVLGSADSSLDLVSGFRSEDDDSTPTDGPAPA